MATDWQVSEVGDTARPATRPGSWRSVQIEWISAWTAHLGFPALSSVPHLLAREIMMNRRHFSYLVPGNIGRIKVPSLRKTWLVFHKTCWLWKPVQVDGHLDWLHFSSGSLNSGTWVWFFQTQRHGLDKKGGDHRPTNSAQWAYHDQRVVHLSFQHKAKTNTETNFVVNLPMVSRPGLSPENFENFIFGHQTTAMHWGHFPKLFYDRPRSWNRRFQRNLSGYPFLICDPEAIECSSSSSSSSRIYL